MSTIEYKAPEYRAAVKARHAQAMQGVKPRAPKASPVAASKRLPLAFIGACALVAIAAFSIAANLI